MTELTKVERINEELTGLVQLFQKVDANQRKAVLPLLQNAAFMKVTLEDLQEKILHDGVVDFYQNGANQSGKKQSATLQSYNALVKNYASVIKTLSQMLPPEERPARTVPTPHVMTEEERAEEIRKFNERCEKSRQEVHEALEAMKRKNSDQEG